MKISVESATFHMNSEVEVEWNDVFDDDGEGEFFSEMVLNEAPDSYWLALFNANFPLAYSFDFSEGEPPRLILHHLREDNCIAAVKQLRKTMDEANVEYDSYIASLEESERQEASRIEARKAAIGRVWEQAKKIVEEENESE